MSCSGSAGANAFSVATAIDAGTAPTLSVLAIGNGEIPFEPANKQRRDFSCV